MKAMRDFKQLPVGYTKLDGEAVNSDLGYTAKRRMAVSMRKYWPNLRAGAKLSTSLLTLFFYDGVFADMNRILCATEFICLMLNPTLMSLSNVHIIAHFLNILLKALLTSRRVSLRNSCITR